MGRRCVIVIGLLLAALVPSSAAHAEGDSIVVLADGSREEPPLGFERPSLVLDANGYPVVVYWADNGQVRLTHCNDPLCIGGDEVLTVVEQNPGSVYNMALALDSSGNPIITYGSSTGLRVVHCNDANCSGDDETMNTFEAPNTEWVSMQLDAAGNPVIAYEAGVPPLGLRLLHCNDPDCGGGDETVNIVEDPGGPWASLALDSNGFPVIAHYEWVTQDLRLTHCNDPACAGGDEYSTSLRETPTLTVKYYDPSLVLDAADRPAITYVVTDALASHLMVMHCDDPDCDGGGESIVAVADNTAGGPVPSLTLDPSGYPVIAYSDESKNTHDLQTNLVLARCTDADCANADRSLVNVDPNERVSWDPSLVLDAAGLPVIAYVGYRHEQLKLARCDDAACLAADGDLDRDGIADADDNCPSQVNPDQGDPDADGLGDVCDPDDDNDGVFDGDDPDDDNDGVLDGNDAFPSDPNETVDSDGDGIGNNADADDDGDGQSDADEAACGSNPLDSSWASADADGDGVPDCVDTPMDTLPPTGTTSALLMCWAIVLGVIGEVLRHISAAPRSRRPSVR
jgi:hypothetical protein